MAFWNRKKKDQPPETAQSLSDIARGMQHTVNSTQELTEHHFQDIIARYFTEEGTAIAKRFILPDGSVMDVPLISLVPPSSLQLSEMTIEMSVRIDRSEVRSAHEEKPDLTRTRFECSFSSRKGDSNQDQSLIDITMKFVAGDPPEGVAKLMEHYTNTSTPKAPEKKAPPATPAP
jgi:hypothetical protein